MVLESLEFTECLFDHPNLREKVSNHEKELDRTSKCIKNLISDTKDIHNALKMLSKAQMALGRTLKGFEMECINNEQTEDEDRITCAMTKFACIIEEIEDARQIWMDVIMDTTINDLENYRKLDIGEVKTQKKLFDKQSSKFSQFLDKYLQTKSKSSEETLLQADNQLNTEIKAHNSQYMTYVNSLLEIDQSKKYKFVETLLTQMINQCNYFRLCNDINNDKFVSEREVLQNSLSTCRSNFEVTTSETKQLCAKLCDMHNQESIADMMTSSEGKKGYLFIMEKKALVTTWNKYFCIYNKNRREMRHIAFQPGQSKYPSPNSTHWNTCIISQCTRRAADTIERRFCFDLHTPDKNTPLTVQATNEVEMKSWLNILDGKDPIYTTPQHTNDFESCLDEVGFQFVAMCIEAIETRGLDEQGLYRVVGVNSKIYKLTTLGLDKKKQEKLDLLDEHEYELKTITSSLKNFFRKLPDPVISFEMHNQFLEASHYELLTQRMDAIHKLVYKLKPINRRLLKILMCHLKTISDNHLKNKMNISNLGICFGPTLMRSPTESIASIMNLKFCNIVVEIMIEYYEKIFEYEPSNDDTSDISSGQNDKNFNRNSSYPNGSGDAKPKTATSLTRRLTTTVADARLAAATNSAAISAALREKRVSLAHHNGSKSSKTKTGAGGGATSINSPSPAGGNTSTPVPVNSLGYDSHSPASNWKAGSSSYSSVTGQIIRSADGPLKNYSASRSRPLNRQDPITPSQEDGMKIDGISKNRLHSSQSISSNTSPRRTNSEQSSSYARMPRSGSAAATSSLDSDRGHPWMPSSPYWNHSESQTLPKDISQSKSTISNPSSNLGSQSNISTPNSPPRNKRRTLRTLYSCEAECDSELSFKPNEIIRDAYSSNEPGWLFGTMNGKKGMIPENYVEDVPDV